MSHCGRLSDREPMATIEPAVEHINPPTQTPPRPRRTPPNAQLQIKNVAFLPDPRALRPTWN
eukprot:5319292-Pyramimonas_sp.AAC.1